MTTLILRIKSRIHWRKFSKALYQCNTSEIELLLAQGFDINSRDAFGQTPVIFAVAFGCLDLLTLLLDKGAQLPEAESSDAGFILASAVKRKNTKVLSLLLSQGLSPNMSDSSTMTPLMWAITMEDVEAVQMLLKYGAKVNLVDQRGRNALQYAMSRRDPTLRELIETA